MTEHGKIRIAVSVSPDLPKKEVAQEIERVLESALDEGLGSFMPEGKLVVFALSRRDRFQMLDKAITDISLIRKIYNDRSLLSNPELSEELSEIGKHLQAVVDIIDRRKKVFRNKRISREKNGNERKNEGEAENGGEA